MTNILIAIIAVILIVILVVYLTSKNNKVNLYYYGTPHYRSSLYGHYPYYGYSRWPHSWRGGWRRRRRR